MYFFYEKYYKPIIVQYHIADCVSWVLRLTVEIARTNVLLEQNSFVYRELTVHGNMVFFTQSQIKTLEAKSSENTMKAPILY